MFVELNFQPIRYDGSSQTVRTASADYARQEASRFSDEPARLTPRQANFYRNLINMAIQLKSDVLPVDFTAADGARMYLDRGCMKIAEHARFIHPLVNDAAGFVSSIQLSWHVTLPTRRS